MWVALRNNILLINSEKLNLQNIKQPDQSKVTLAKNEMNNTNTQTHKHKQQHTKCEWRKDSKIQQQQKLINTNKIKQTNTHTHTNTAPKTVAQKYREKIQKKTIQTVSRG